MLKKVRKQGKYEFSIDGSITGKGKYRDGEKIYYKEDKKTL